MPGRITPLVNEEYMSSPFLCATNKILDLFPSKLAYKEFLEDQIDYGKSLEILKHQIFDED